MAKVDMVDGTMSMAKKAAWISAGAAAGIGVQKLVNKFFSSETVVSGLGADVSSGLKNYATPLITLALGSAGAFGFQSQALKHLSLGVAVSGGVNCVSQLMWGRNSVAGMDDGLLGGILGADEDLNDENGFYGVDDDDDDDLDGFDDDEDGLGDLEDYNELPAGGAIAALDIPIDRQYHVRDEEFEKEPISGFGFGNIDDEIL
ncbi:MAG: hypothetical protein II956_14530 [Bacteroidales bacterium]|nr:hypothetical protein [Bacteroidales bacterium]